MPDWNKFSGRSQQEREAAFEAQAMAELVKSKPPPPAAPPAPPVTDGIQIIVTAHGQTSRYDNLASVPPVIRQRILQNWQPVVAASPVQPVAKPKSRRAGVLLNLFLPGMGQFYLGRPVWGCVYAMAFLGCFVGTAVLFLSGYNQYMGASAGGDILDPGNLEKLSESFHLGWLCGLQLLAVAIYAASTIHLFVSRPAE